MKNIQQIEKRFWLSGFKKRDFGFQLSARVGSRGVVWFQGRGWRVVKWYHIYG